MSLERLAPRQAESVRDAEARINIWDGAVSSGKTVGSIVAWIKYVRQGPPGELLMAGKTERTLKRNVIDPMTEYLGPRRCRLVSGSGELWLLGRRVYLAGANDLRAEGRIRGLSLVALYGDEITLWPEGFWTMALSRLRRPGARLFGTTNPDGPAHWLKRNFLDRAGALNLARFQFTLDDNPFLPADYVAAIKAEYTGLWYQRFILGRWVLAEGAIYDGWQPDRHVVRRLPPITRWWVGIDYGTVNPFVALLLGLGTDGRVYVVSEYRWDSRTNMRQKTDSEYSKALREWLSEPRQTGDAAPIVPTPEWVIVDPSAASFIRQLYTDGVRGVRAADNEVLDGIRLVASTLSQDRLRVHESCKGLIDEMPSYVWSPQAQAKGLDEPVKVNDHAVDSLRYSLKLTRSIWWGARLEAA